MFIAFVIGLVWWRLNFPVSIFSRPWYHYHVAQNAPAWHSIQP